ncbi:hypothetical protein GCM10027184_76060 [Saccharothrix stipae]
MTGLICAVTPGWKVLAPLPTHDSNSVSAAWAVGAVATSPAAAVAATRTLATDRRRRDNESLISPVTTEAPP